jgi:uncharacterized protein YndB with AHSA1/START domain
MARPRHVHETYIKASPERIWEALTDPERTKEFYANLSVQSGWEPGGRITYDGRTMTVVEGTIEEIDPPRRLVMTFHMLHTLEVAAEHPSRVTWELTPVTGEVTRVTLVHGDLALSPATWQETAGGWGLVMAGLKSVVETGAGMGDVPGDDGSVHASTDPDEQLHRRLGIEGNNETYELLGRSARSADDDARMIHMAHAAAHHWYVAGNRTNWARAEYLVSRAYAFAGRAEPALFHAERCATHVAAAGLADFDLAYAHEARARALACAGRLDEASAERAVATAVPIVDPEDKAIVEADLRDGPWYGLDGA